MIDITDEQMEIVRSLLALHVPKAKVLAFGSRTDGTSGKHSDLDLAVVGSEKIDFSAMNRLREAFEDSELPFRVDVLDWHGISESFRKVIAEHNSVLQPGQEVCQAADLTDKTE